MTYRCRIQDDFYRDGYHLLVAQDVFEAGKPVRIDVVTGFEFRAAKEGVIHEPGDGKKNG